MRQPAEYFNGLLATDLEALALLPRATFRVVAVPSALPCGDSSIWMSLSDTSRSPRRAKPMSHPGRDGLDAAKTGGIEGQDYHLPALRHAPAVVHTVQAVYGPIKLEGIIAQKVADFEGVFRPRGKF